MHRSAPANDVHSHDPYVDRALAAMIAEPSRRWSVTALARVACLSRAPFARRFHRATGTSPLRWLTNHRLLLASHRLQTTERGLADIATEIGYTTEFSFSKAFKRHYGVPPSSFRRSASTFRAAA